MIFTKHLRLQNIYWKDDFVFKVSKKNLVRQTDLRIIWLDY